jgi:hypothetical protein
MKRIHLALVPVLIALVSAAPVTAQEGGSMFLGLAAGGSYSGLRGDFSSDADAQRNYKWGFAGGATFEAFVKRNAFSIKVDALYTQKGAGGIADGANNIDLNLAYIEVPVMLNVNVPLSYKWSVAFYSGISVGFNISCDLESSDGTSVSCSDSGGDVDPKSTDIGWPFGLGILYWPSGRTGSYLAFDARYVYGISNAFEDSAGNVKNQTFELLVRYAFKLK